MRFRVETPYWVRMTGVELAEHLEAVRRVLLEHEHITDVTIDHRRREDEITVTTIVEVTDHRDAGRMDAAAVKAAVIAVGSAATYKLWDFDGPTRVTPI